MLPPFRSLVKSSKTVTGKALLNSLQYTKPCHPPSISAAIQAVSKIIKDLLQVKSSLALYHAMSASPVCCRHKGCQGNHPRLWYIWQFSALCKAILFQPVCCFHSGWRWSHPRLKTCKVFLYTLWNSGLTCKVFLYTLSSHASLTSMLLPFRLSGKSSKTNQ